MMKVLTVVGARPQFVKAAVVSRAFNEVAPRHIREVLVHTGQHYDEELSDIFFKQLGIPAPAYHLGIGSAPHGAQTGRMLEALEQVLSRERPERVLVYGDTNSTLAGALAAAKLNLPLAHVEAGLRSFKRSMPEEVNRVLTDHVSDLLFCPTKAAVENLRREGITSGVRLVGDVMYDCVLAFKPLAEKCSRILERLEVSPKGYFLATVHRAENTDDPARLKSILGALVELNDRVAPVVWPVHPRSRRSLEEHGIPLPSTLRATPPLPYLDLQRLMAGARCVLTDSGGMQKEALFHGVPCLTMRDETEWVETIEHGFNYLVGADGALIVERAREARPPRGRARSLYGDGRASAAIVEALLGSEEGRRRSGC